MEYSGSSSFLDFQYQYKFWKFLLHQSTWIVLEEQVAVGLFNSILANWFMFFQD
jgi:hypothetical protein